MNTRWTIRGAALDYSKRKPVRLFSGALFLWITLATCHAQVRVPLQWQSGDLGIRIHRSPDGGSITLAPSGMLHPIRYRTATTLPATILHWSTLAITPDPGWVDHGALTVPALEGSRIFSAVYPDHSKFNGFVRIPTNATPEELTTLVVVLHPSQMGPNSGYALEMDPDVSPFLDQHRLVSYFPSALNDDGRENRWNGLNGPQASDYAALFNGIELCKRQVPTISKVKLLAYSDGVGTAIGFAQLYPGRIDGLLLFAGYHNPRVARYVESINGGRPVRLDPPMPVVGIAAPRDTDFFPEIRKACQWFAAANGFSGNPTTNSLKRDYNAFVAGPDSTIVSLGSHVRFIISDARDHVASLFSSTNGASVLFGGFLKSGLMPGTEADSPTSRSVLTMGVRGNSQGPSTPRPGQRAYALGP